MHLALQRLAAAAAFGVATLHCLISYGSSAVGREGSKPFPAPSVVLEKTVLGADVPLTRSEFSISPDGKRSYFGFGSAYYVFDETGDLVARMPTKSNARTLALLAGGRFISAQSAAYGHVALLGADGVELRALVARGSLPRHLRQDTTGWTSPCGLAFDPIHRLLFVLDTTAGIGTPHPDWSRIATFDADGNYLRQIAAYDANKAPPTDERRTWYDDIEVDAKRSVVYVTARASKELWAFDYDGTPRGRVPGVTGIAVLPNGDVAVGDPDVHHVRIYDSTLRLVKTLVADGVLDLEADAAGRLYASLSDPTVLYLRWPATLSEPTAVRPRFEHISVGIPFDTAAAGAPFSLRVAVDARPAPAEDAWHIFARPSDGSDLSWRELDATYADGALDVRPAAELQGLYDVAVRFGSGAISAADAASDLHVQKTILFESDSENGSVGVRSISGRSGFRRGETVAFRVDTRKAAGASATVTLENAGKEVARSSVPTASGYWQLPGALTRRLPPGHYVLRATLGSLPSTPFEFDLAEAEPDSPLQRILYHEFDQDPATLPQVRPAPNAERLAYVRDYLESVEALGFSRETDRSAFRLANNKVAGTWRADTAVAPAPHDLVPISGIWEPEFYLDRATALGVHEDSQLLSHCSGVRLADSWFPALGTTLQHVTQWFGKYPSFYGFNYNDEVFFSNVPFTDSSPADKAWLDTTIAQLAGRPKADAYRAGLAHMYGELDEAVTEVRPDLARTATPMWQYPAVDGSYAPTVYAHMTESYSHYLSEGYGWPFYPAHSADMLRRPGLPLMGVFDNAQRSGDGESYLKDALQVLGRGVQGVGVEHARPLRDGRASDALRTMNELAKAYGPIFSQATPSNEAAVLYSYAQDVTEKRDILGTPHWERVLALYGAGLMAGLPMNIAYEEDIVSGALLERGQPKVKLLFLAGQTVALPAATEAALQAFVSAGGRIVVDADSLDFPGAVRFPHSLLGPADAGRKAMDSDALFPDTQPAYEALASALHDQFADARGFPIDTDDPWIAKNHFKAGAIDYVLISSETSPYPWDAATAWGLGALYTKSYQPKRVQLTVPHATVIYDVFERQPAAQLVSGKSSLIRADLSLFPGRLYAFLPRPLEAPKVTARVGQNSVSYSVNVGMPALIPLRIVLKDRRGQVSTLFRATDLRGELESAVARPLGAGPWRLEVSELLTGTSSEIDIPSAELPQSWLRPSPAAETEREPQIRRLLSKGSREIQLVGAVDELSSEVRAALSQALAARGLKFAAARVATPPTSPVTYLALATVSGSGLGELLQAANQEGLFSRKLGDAYPGAGRGFVSAVFSPRAYHEDCIAVVGGDQRGLNVAVQRLVALLNEEVPTRPTNQSPDARPPVTLVGTQGPSVDMPRLSERVGIRLSGIRASHGKLVVSAAGYLANVARIDDQGNHGRVVSVARVGESPTTTSLFVSNDGASYGVAARTIRRFGEGLSIFSTSATTPDVFASFGDAAPFEHVFSASADASTVLAPGSLGVVAWQRKASGWKEAWAVDYWKTFDELDWPVAADTARIPSFDTIVPRDGDVALIAFAELTNNGWVQNQTASAAEVSSRSLKDGTLRWHFSAPIAGTLVFPKLYANDDGSLVVLQAQLGTWGRESFRYYALADGRLAGSWNSADAPLALDVSDRTGRIAAIYGNSSRLLEVRLKNGTVAFSRTWHSQPLAVVFAEDGASVFVSDDAGVVSRLDAHGEIVWQAQLGCSAELTRDETGLYAAGWDGRVRAFTAAGGLRWRLDLSEPMAALTARSENAPASVHEAQRNALSASTVIPSGVNLLRSGQATLKVGGTPGWKSGGRVELDGGTLTNGVLDDAVDPWLSREELYWDGTTSRKIWAEMDLARPTNLHSLTVYENPNFPESWPSESLIQVWDEARQGWRTAMRAAFLHGPVTRYALDLKGVTKLRYVFLGNYFRNFHTSEIELR
jgi:hypothetical protein